MNHKRICIVLLLICIIIALTVHLGVYSHLTMTNIYELSSVTKYIYIIKLQLRLYIVYLLAFLEILRELREMVGFVRAVFTS